MLSAKTNLDDIFTYMTKMAIGPTIVAELPFYFFWLGCYNRPRGSLQQ